MTKQEIKYQKAHEEDVRRARAEFAKAYPALRHSFDILESPLDLAWKSFLAGKGLDEFLKVPK